MRDTSEVPSLGFPIRTRSSVVRRAVAFWGHGLVIVIEIDPRALRSARFDPVRPLRELRFGIVMAVPALGPVQAEVNFIDCPDELIRQARAAAGTEDDACLAEGVVDFLIPPAGVPEFHDVAARGIELADDVT